MGVGLELRVENNKDFIKSHKEQSGCTDCGIKNPIVLQFHHTDESTKSFSISRGIRKNISVIKEEISKCIVLCANCHILRHEVEKQKILVGELPPKFI